MPISIFLSFYHVLPHIIMPFFNMQRSFRVCVHARVAMHAYESGRKCIHVRNKTFFEGIGPNVSGKRTPLRRKLVTGLYITFTTGTKTKEKEL